MDFAILPQGFLNFGIINRFASAKIEEDKNKMLATQGRRQNLTQIKQEARQKQNKNTKKSL